MDYIKYDSISGNRVWGTAYGIETAEINSIKEYFGVNPVFKGLSLGNIDEDALLFLRRRVIL